MLLRLRFFVLLASTFIGVATSFAQPDYPSAHWVPPACTKYYSSGNGHKFCVIHDMEGYYQSSISYLNRCDTDTNGNYNVSASVYYLVNGLKNGNDEDGNVENIPGDADVGDITQSVRESNYAWHARCWNTWMFGTEHEGFVTSPAWYTEGMYLASALLQRHLCDKFGIPKDRNHIVGHNEWQNSTWTNWMAANFPSIDTTCNNHTDPGQYWDWNHFITLITGSAAITRQPFSVLAETGTSATLSVVVAGSNTLRYAWSKNGVPISGATSSAYTISNVQPANAGGYSVIVTNASGATTSRIASLTISPPWVVAFSDDFETNSASRWNLFWGAGNGVSDFTTNWAFDYGASQYVINGVTNLIPPAPNSGGTTHGLKITCNKNDATASTAGVSLYPKGLVLSNTYALRFDLWINYNGGPGGGSGSTEYATCGLNHSATRVNWLTSASTSDGLWFAVDGEGGSGGTDYRAYQGNGAAPTQLSFANGGLASSGAGRDHFSDPVWQAMFPATAYETSGAPGKHWVQGELSQIGNVITWQINGVVVAQRTNSSSYISGNVMIGYMDAFNSIANPAADNYGIFDNVRVLVPATAPLITNQPQSITVIQGANAVFTASASGNPSPAYQWRFGGTNIAGATGASYTRTNAQTANAGSYSVVASNIAGSATSSLAVLTVLTPPVIASQPQSITTNQGGTASFFVSVTGSAPLAYDWQFNGGDTGVTTTNYTLIGVQPANAGAYRCIITNSAGATTSAVATLTVNVPPSITNQPQSLTVKVGSNATFMVLAGGTAPLAYQWRFKGTNIPTATLSTYTRQSVQTNDAGFYSVLLSNAAGNIPSSNALLTVLPLLPLKFDSISFQPGDQLRLVLSGEPGTYAIRKGSNLVDWVLWTNVTIGANSVEIFDSTSNTTVRFYRAAQTP